MSDTNVLNPHSYKIKLIIKSILWFVHYYFAILNIFLSFKTFFLRENLKQSIKGYFARNIHHYTINLLRIRVFQAHDFIDSTSQLFFSKTKICQLQLPNCDSKSSILHNLGDSYFFRQVECYKFSLSDLLHTPQSINMTVFSIKQHKSPQRLSQIAAESAWIANIIKSHSFSHALDNGQLVAEWLKDAAMKE